jgi:hypothetical protein
MIARPTVDRNGSCTVLEDPHELVSGIVIVAGAPIEHWLMIVWPSHREPGGPQSWFDILEVWGRQRGAYGQQPVSREERAFEAGHIFVLTLQGKAERRRRIARLTGPVPFTADATGPCSSGTEQWCRLSRDSGHRFREQTRSRRRAPRDVRLTRLRSRARRRSRPWRACARAGCSSAAPSR